MPGSLARAGFELIGQLADIDAQRSDAVDSDPVFVALVQPRLRVDIILGVGIHLLTVAPI